MLTRIIALHQQQARVQHTHIELSIKNQQLVMLDSSQNRTGISKLNKKCT